MAQHLGLQVVQIDPADVLDLGRVRRHGKARRGFGDEDVDQFMLGQPLAHIGPVFDAAGMDRRQAGDPQFLAQAADGAGGRVLVPEGMGAAGVRPETRRVILPRRALLDQDARPLQHEDRHRLVAQAALVHLKLAHGREAPVDPGRDPLFQPAVHQTQPGFTRPSRCATFFTPIFRCARGRAATSFLFM